MIRAEIGKEEAIQQAARSLAELLGETEQRRKRLPPEADPSWLVRELVALAGRSDLEFASIAQGLPEDFQRFTRLSVTLQFSCPYHQLGAFVDAIEHAEHFMRIAGLTMKRGELHRDPMIDMTVETLYVPPAGALQPASS